MENNLITASLSKDPQTFESLVRNGEDVNILNPEDGKSLLMMLSTVGAFSKIRIAIRAGVKLDVTDTQGMTALMYASKAGNTRSVDVLLYAGANPKLKNKVGQDAAALATLNGHVRIANVINLQDEKKIDHVDKEEEEVELKSTEEPVRPKFKF